MAGERSVCQPQKFLHLLVPILPVVSARELAELVRNLSLQQQAAKIAVISEIHRVFRTAIYVEERQ